MQPSSNDTPASIQVTVMGFDPVQNRKVAIADTACPVLIEGHYASSLKTVSFIAFFTPLRIKEWPSGYRKYSIRERNEDGDPATVEAGVLVNHFGDIFTESDLHLDDPAEHDFVHIDEFRIL